MFKLSKWMRAAFGLRRSRALASEREVTGSGEHAALRATKEAANAHGILLFCKQLNQLQRRTTCALPRYSAACWLSPPCSSPPCVSTTAPSSSASGPVGTSLAAAAAANARPATTPCPSRAAGEHCRSARSPSCSSTPCAECTAGTAACTSSRCRGLPRAAASRATSALWRELQQTPEGHAIKKSRWPLLNNPWNLTRKQRQKLSEIQKNNKRLYRAYLLKEALAKALDYRQPWRARKALDEWLAWASRSRQAAFLRVAHTIRKYKEGILAYIEERLTNGIVEGINNRIRMVARRAFGFHSAEALMAMLYLCCSGIQLNPPLPGSTH